MNDTDNPWGIRLYLDRTESTHNSGVFYSQVAAGPTSIVMNAVLNSRRHGSLGQALGGLWGKLFGKPTAAAEDPFETDVSVDLRGWMDEHGGAHKDCMDAEPGDLTRDLLADPQIRTALVEATRAAHRVHVNRRRIVLCCSSSTLGFNPSRDLDPMEQAAANLAIALERWARGEPGGQPRGGCRDRRPEEWPLDLERSPWP